VLRAGSSVTQVSVSLVQEGETRAVLLAGFGGERESALAVDAAPRNPRPSLAPPSELEPLPHVPGMTPDFFAHVDLRIAAGGMPFSGADEPDFGGYMRFRTPPARFGDRELLTLADAWPPAIMPMLTGPASMSSLAWTFEPIPSPHADAPDAFWQYDVTTHHAAGGYARTTARIWDTHGALRALSHQTVAYFA
ncbi:MAG TPA: thioesterase family protein, partial [Solirubrobacteraceae bacterium]|nr:thioesterase family protein [Solirubrobacteraceae bacterium]